MIVVGVGSGFLGIVGKTVVGGLVGTISETVVGFSLWEQFATRV